MPLHKDLKDAIHTISVDSKLFHDIVHGNQGATVSTEGGQIKTVASAIHDIEAQLERHFATVATLAENVKTLYEEIKRLEASAKQSSTQALQSVGAVKASSGDPHPSHLSEKLKTSEGLTMQVKQTNTGEQLEFALTSPFSSSIKLYLSAHFI